MTEILYSPGAAPLSAVALDTITRHMLETGRTEIQRLAPEALAVQGQPAMVLLVSEPDLVDRDGAPPEAVARLDAAQPGEVFVEVIPAEDIIDGLREHPQVPPDAMRAIERKILAPVPRGFVCIVLLHAHGVGVIAAEVSGGSAPIPPLFSAANRGAPS